MTLWQLIKAEIRSVLTNPVVTLTVFGGVVFIRFCIRCHTHNKPLESSQLRS